MNLDEAIEVYKSQRALATALGITEAAVANWRSRGRIPDLQQFRLYHLSGGKLKPDYTTLLHVQGGTDSNRRREGK